MTEEIQLYIDQVAEVRSRLEIIKLIDNGELRTGNDTVDIEILLMQFRKSLELIAFSSLIANKEIYAETHQRFSREWRAKGIISNLEKINPDFYPKPMREPEITAEGTKHFTPLSDEFLSIEEFVILYDACSSGLHARNPFSNADPIIQLQRTVQEWVMRIQKLVEWHVMHFVGGDMWIINVPTNGKQVSVARASPIN